MNLLELPTPNSSRTDWPWIYETPKLSETMSDGSPWPRISIITPSFNQGEFLEETIRSVLLQGYPNLEYIIIDGGSSDGSQEIIRKYEPWLTYWVSEPDSGQADAINKGLEVATGEIVAWLNSDDVYVDGCLFQVVKELELNSSMAVVYGDSIFINSHGEVVGSYNVAPFNIRNFLFECFIPQPSSFIRRWALDGVGLLNPKYFFILDYQLWMRIALRYPIKYVPQKWSYFRRHAQSKSTLYETRRWSETLDMLDGFFQSSLGFPDADNLKDRVIGNAHWHASLAYWEISNYEATLFHLYYAIKLDSTWVSRGKSKNIIVSYALRTTNPELWLHSYFDLAGKMKPIFKGHERIVLSHYFSKMALSPNVSDYYGRRFAFKSLILDFTKVIDRNIMNRIISGLVSKKMMIIIYDLLRFFENMALKIRKIT